VLLLLQVRDAFRRFRAAAPDAWDYDAADIPAALTEQLEAAQQSKKVSSSAGHQPLSGDGSTAIAFGTWTSAFAAAAAAAAV
jgi:hypothetical protein